MYVMKKLDCSDLGNRPYDRPTEKSYKKCLFREKKCVDRTTLAVRMTG